MAKGTIISPSKPALRWLTAAVHVDLAAFTVALSMACGAQRPDMGDKGRQSQGIDEDADSAIERDAGIADEDSARPPLDANEANGTGPVQADVSNDAKALDDGRPSPPGDSQANDPRPAEAQAPSFSWIYQEILSASCAGATCHNPGAGHGVRLWNRDMAYENLRGKENLVDQLQGRWDAPLGIARMGPFMPPYPYDPLPVAQIEIIASWVRAGWPDN